MVKVRSYWPVLATDFARKQSLVLWGVARPAKGPSDISKLLDMLQRTAALIHNSARSTNSVVVAISVDGERAVWSSFFHSDYWRNIRAFTGNVQLVQLARAILVHEDVPCVSDYLHVIKRARIRLVTKLHKPGHHLVVLSDSVIVTLDDVIRVLGIGEVADMPATLCDDHKQSDKIALATFDGRYFMTAFNSTDDGGGAVALLFATGALISAALCLESDASQDDCLSFLYASYVLINYMSSATVSKAGQRYANTSGRA